MSHILNLVERLLTVSDVRNRLSQVPSASSRPGQYVAEDGTVFGPCLLISRQCGSGSSLLAEKVGELLGWDVFDSKIVDEIARNAHVHQRLVQSVDEHVRSQWDRTWHEFLLDDLSDQKYLCHLKEVVMALGHHGNVVIVGRGAKYFLPSQCAVRVRLVGPLDARATRVAERLKLPLEKARSKVEQVDRERAAFVWKTFRKDIDSPLHQDIMINTGRVSIESAVKIVMAVLQEKLGVSSKQYPVLCRETGKVLV
jgi:cytidylate kinase